MIKKILVPYDGSKYSKKALSHAEEIASKFDATMFLLTVVDEHEYLHGVLLAELEDDYKVKDTVHRLVKSEVIAAKKMMSRLAKNYEKNKVKVHHHAMKGDPTEAILDYTLANNIDLIILGSEGLSGFSKLKALGSVSRRVSELAKCPVMIVR